MTPEQLSKLKYPDIIHDNKVRTSLGECTAWWTFDRARDGVVEVRRKRSNLFITEDTAQYYHLASECTNPHSKAK